MSSPQTAILNDSAESSNNKGFAAPAQKKDNSRDNSLISDQANRMFITKYLKPLIGISSDTEVNSFFNDQKNMKILKQRLRKQMAAVLFEQMRKEKTIEERDGKYYYDNGKEVSKEEMLNHIENKINDQHLNKPLDILKLTLKDMTIEEKITNRNNNINRLDDVIKEAKDVIIKKTTELINVNKKLLDAMYKQDRTISSIRSEQIANEQAYIYNLELDQSTAANKLALMDRKQAALETEIQNKHNKKIENMQRKVNDLIKAQNNSINKAHKHARAAAAAQLAATQAAAVAQLDATQAVAASQKKGFEGTFKGLNNINDNIVEGSKKTIEGLNIMNENLLGGFNDLGKDLQELGNSFNNGFDNLTSVMDVISNEITHGNAEMTGKIEELAAAIQGIQSGIQSEFKGEVPLQNSSSSSTLPSSRPSLKDPSTVRSARNSFGPIDPSIYAPPKPNAWVVWLNNIINPDSPRPQTPPGYN